MHIQVGRVAGIASLACGSSNHLLSGGGDGGDGGATTRTQNCVHFLPATVGQLGL